MAPRKKGLKLLYVTSLTSCPNKTTRQCWIGEALTRWRDDPAVAAVLKKKIPEWLSLYSLAPERMMFRQAGRDTEEQVQEERARREEEIQRHIGALTDMERGKMALLTDAPEPHFGDLQSLALQPLRGIGTIHEDSKRVRPDGGEVERIPYISHHAADVLGARY